MTETNGGSPPPPQQQPRRQPPPMLSLPQKQNQNQTASSFENIFNTGGAASGFSPGPMTLVSNYFSDHFSDGSFSQLLAGAMNSPVSSQINPSHSLDNSNNNKTSFKDKKPMDLVIAQSPTGFMFPNLFSPSGLLNSPGFFSPLQSPLVSHQQALAHVTAQAALSQSYFNNVQPENYNGGLGTVADEEETRMVNANVELEDSQIGSPDELSVSQSDVSESQHVVSGTSDINDGYNWRKYGQKQVKASEHPRSYYKCTHPNCPVKKKVGQALDGHISDIVYKGKHNHDPPPPNKRGKESADVNKTNNSQMETRVAEHPVVDQGFNQMMRNDPVFSQLMGNDPGFSQLMRNDYGFNQMERNDQGFNQLRTNDQGSNPLTRNDQGSNQLTGNDQGSNQLIRIDEPNDEPNPKRRNTEARPVTVPADRSTSAQKVVSEPKIVVQTRSEVDLLDDGFKWRKYGQKVVKGNTNPRSYYKCTFPGCNVRKHVERAPLDPKSVVTTYEGKHNHDIPVSRHRGYNNNNGSGGTAAKRKEPKLGNNERPVLLQMKEEEITA